MSSSHLTRYADVDVSVDSLRVWSSSTRVTLEVPKLVLKKNLPHLFSFFCKGKELMKNYEWGDDDDTIYACLPVCLFACLAVCLCGSQVTCHLATCIVILFLIALLTHAHTAFSRALLRRE